ncbi:MAG: IS1182 family transposase [Mangrovibacterium sp.]
MPHLAGEPRNQLIMISLENSVPQDAFVRVIDAFVDAIDMESFGFDHTTSKDEGRPCFHPSILMKLYLYGYRYGIRSSRKLEREARLNIEALWLTSCQNPRYKTIADFRKKHAKAFRQVFRSFVVLLKDWNMVDGKTIAIDSFKIRAQNSLKNNLNLAKIERHLAYIDAKIDQYQAELDLADRDDQRQELQKKIQAQQARKSSYKAAEKKLRESGQDQISLTDPDARAVVLHRNIVNVGYNVQASVDSKNKLLVEFDTGEINDSHALAPMAQATKQLLNTEQMDVLADKGYHTGEELQQCEKLGITTYISPKATAPKDSGVFPGSDFIYSLQDDSYTCPAGQTMKTNKVWHAHSGKERTPAFRFQRYTTTACKKCLLGSQCTKGKANGRVIHRSEFAASIERNNSRVTANPNYYRQRQQIAEHPFGTLKRQRGFTFTLMKGKHKVLAEVGLEFIGYNLVRCISVVGITELIKKLKKHGLLVLKCLLKSFLARIRMQAFSNPKKLFLVVQKIGTPNSQQISIIPYI